MCPSSSPPRNLSFLVLGLFANALTKPSILAGYTIPFLAHQSAETLLLKRLNGSVSASLCWVFQVALQTHPAISPWALEQSAFYGPSGSRLPTVGARWVLKGEWGQRPVHTLALQGCPGPATPLVTRRQPCPGSHREGGGCSSPDTWGHHTPGVYPPALEPGSKFLQLF